MHRTRRQRVSTLLSPFVVLALVAAVTAAFTTTAGASPSSSSSSAAAAAVKRSVRQISRGLTLSFPTNQRVGNVPGVQNPEIKPGEPEEGGGEGDARTAARAATAGGHRLIKAGNRSMSVRPTAKTAPLRAQEADLTIPNVRGMRVQGTPGLRRSFEGLNHFDQRTANNGNHFPSAAYVTLRNGRVTGNVHVAGRGRGPEDSFCEYVAFNCAQTDPPAIRPRWGDYGAAVPVGDSVWIASEWTGQTCTFAQYLNDFTCGQTRTALANWSTRISLVRP